MKKGFRRSLALLLAVFMAFGAAPFALGVAVFAEDAQPTTIGINPQESTIMVGEEKTLQISGAYMDENGKPAFANITNTDVYWATSDDEKVSVTKNGVITGIAVTDTPVEIIATYKGDSTVTCKCTVTVVKAPVYVDSITWNWKATAMLAGMTYYFDDSHYTMVPDKPDNTEVELTWSPARALQKVVDPEKGVGYKVNALNSGETQLVVTLTLTAKGASKECQPATKQVTVLADVPLTSVKWNYAVGSTGRTLFKYYTDGSAVKEKNYHEYKYTAYNNSTALDASALELCKVKITSSDNRVVRPYDDGKCFIPVGNGEAKVTVSVTTPGNKTKSDTIIVVVQDSPYTPITVAGIGYDDKSAGTTTSYDSASNTLSMMFNSSIQLTAQLNDKASLKQGKIEITTENGKKMTIVSPCEYTWTSSDPEVATVDQNGKVNCVGVGKAEITLTIRDNGTELVKKVNVKSSMTWWEAVLGIFFSIITFNFAKVGKYFKALFG